YTATATDVDAGQTLSYSLSGTDAASFDINASTGVVTLKSSANYEAKNSYSFNVVATDSGTEKLTDTKVVTVNVTDVNDPTSGSLTINGKAQQGETLSLVDTLSDEDGISVKTYQWYADGQAINGAKQTSLVLGQDQVGKVITVNASFTEGLGRQAVKSSLGTVAVVNVNDAPTGEVSITGNAGIGQTLTASNTLADLDGMGPISYQWQFMNESGQWQNIPQAISASYTVAPQYALQQLTLKASFVDAQGTSETVYSKNSVKAGGLPPTLMQALENDSPALVSNRASPQEELKLSALPRIFNSSALSFNSSDALSHSSVIPTSADSTQTPNSMGLVKLGAATMAGAGLRTSQSTITVFINRGEASTINLPAGLFEHTDENARVRLSARLEDGSPLPNDIDFNSTNGSLAINIGLDLKSEQLQIVVTALDEDGQTVSVKVVINIKEKARSTSAIDAPMKLGKPTLTEQLRLADKPAGHLAELAALSQAFAATTAQHTSA
ncbi:MAG: hypothetical protein RL084_1052, partial [Pseudomonadota bacterium]